MQEGIAALSSNEWLVLSGVGVAAAFVLTTGIRRLATWHALYQKRRRLHDRYAGKLSRRP